MSSSSGRGMVTTNFARRSGRTASFFSYIQVNCPILIFELMKKFFVEIQWWSFKKFLEGGIGAEIFSILEIAELQFFYEKFVRKVKLRQKSIVKIRIFSLSL